MIEDIDWLRVGLVALVGGIIGGISGWKSYRGRNALIGKRYAKVGMVVARGTGIGRLPVTITQPGIAVGDLQRWQVLDTVVVEDAGRQAQLYITQEGAWAVDAAGNLLTLCPSTRYHELGLQQVVADAGFNKSDDHALKA